MLRFRGIDVTCLSIHHHLILFQILFISHVSLSLSLLYGLLNLQFLFNLIDNVECPVSPQEVGPPDLEPQSFDGLLLKERVINQLDHPGILVLDVFEVRVNHLAHVEPLLLLAHVVVDHLDVLHRASLLSVLGQRDRALVLRSHVVHEVLCVPDQIALDRVDERAGTLGETVRTAGL